VHHSGSYARRPRPHHRGVVRPLQRRGCWTPRQSCALTIANQAAKPLPSPPVVLERRAAPCASAFAPLAGGRHVAGPLLSYTPPPAAAATAAREPKMPHRLHLRHVTTPPWLATPPGRAHACLRRCPYSSPCTTSRLWPIRGGRARSDGVALG
jgi:hypothetical protein